MTARAAPVQAFACSSQPDICAASWSRRDEYQEPAWVARRDDGDGLNGAHDVEYILAGFGLFAATPAGFGSYPDRGSADINAQPRARNRRETVGLSTLSRATYLPIAGPRSEAKNTRLALL